MAKREPGWRQNVEAGLRQLYGTPTPNPVFKQTLAHRLVHRAAAPSDDGSGLRSRAFGRMPRQPRWAAVVALVLCLLAGAVLLVGPQTTWAAFQSWLGFIPGFGFAELDRVRVLAEPAAIEVDGLTVEIIQVVVHEATQLTFEISGLPETESPARRFFDMQDHVDVALTLASGETLTPTGYMPYYGTRASVAGLAVFPPLATREEQPRLRIVTDA